MGAANYKDNTLDTRSALPDLLQRRAELLRGYNESRAAIKDLEDRGRLLLREISQIEAEVDARLVKLRQESPYGSTWNQGRSVPVPAQEGS